MAPHRVAIVSRLSLMSLDNEKKVKKVKVKTAWKKFCYGAIET